MFLRFSCALVAVALLASAPALAQEAPDEERIARAREAFEQGAAAYERGDLVGALRHFERSYELTGNPDVLFNLGTVADRLGRSADALRHFEQFLRARPSADERPALEARIAQLRAEVGEPEPDPPEEAEPQEEPPAEEPATDPTQEETSPPPPEPAVAPAPSRFPLRWTWLPAGLSLASGVTAIALWVKANDIHDSLEERCRTLGCTEDEVDDSGGELRVTLTNVFLGVAAAAGAAAVAVGVLELMGGDDGEAQVDLAVAPGGVLVRGSF